jgi:hypothetical protein
MTHNERNIKRRTIEVRSDCRSYPEWSQSVDYCRDTYKGLKRLSEKIQGGGDRVRRASIHTSTCNCNAQKCRSLVRTIRSSPSSSSSSSSSHFPFSFFSFFVSPFPWFHCSGAPSTAANGLSRQVLFAVEGSWNLDAPFTIEHSQFNVSDLTVFTLDTPYVIDVSDTVIRTTTTDTVLVDCECQKLDSRDRESVIALPKSGRLSLCCCLECSRAVF